MTTYRAIASTETDPEAPITSTLMKALQQNVLAISEGDSTVPGLLRNTALLGTIATTSGTTQTLSSLVLTPYRYLFISFDGLSIATNTSANFAIAGIVVGISSGFAAVVVNGFGLFDLTGSGTAFGVGSSSPTAFVGSHSLTTASTSISATVSASTFDAGSVRIYGVK